MVEIREICGAVFVWYQCAFAFFFPLFCTFIPLELTHGRGTDAVRI